MKLCVREMAMAAGVEHVLVVDRSLLLDPTLRLSEDPAELEKSMS